MLQFLIKFSVSLAVMYIFYRIILRPLTFYQWNRFYLLCYSLFSLIIPFINITPWMVKEGVHTNQLVTIIPVVDNYMAPVGNRALPLVDNYARGGSGWLLLFFAGATIVGLRLLLRYLSVRRIRGKSVLLNSEDAVQLYQTAEQITPFCFGNAIILLKIFIRRQNCSALSNTSLYM